MTALLPKRFFVTGTDTEVGKTYCSALMTRLLRQQGKTIFPFKPISAGTEALDEFGGELVNEDAAALYKACEGDFSLKQINPIVFDQPIAPHIAAAKADTRLSISKLNQAYISVPNTEYLLVEGAGGWLLPLNEQELMSQWVAEQKLPVLMVVGVKLGCLNHALLTADAIVQSGASICGWVANFIEPETEVGRENVNYLKHQLKQRHDIDCFFEVGYQQGELIDS